MATQSTLFDPKPKRPARAASVASRPEAAAKDQASVFASRPWTCTNVLALDAASHRWWRSVHGVVVCAVCYPPSFPWLATEQGGPSEAPLVEVGRGSTPVATTNGGSSCS